MKTFLVLHYGFEMPTPEIMADWNKWFESLGDRLVEMAHLPNGREFFADGSHELPLEKDSITGYTFITAENFEEAAKIASECPAIASTRVYEIKK